MWPHPRGITLTCPTRSPFPGSPNGVPELRAAWDLLPRSQGWHRPQQHLGALRPDIVTAATVLTRNGVRPVTDRCYGRETTFPQLDANLCALVEPYNG